MKTALIWGVAAIAVAVGLFWLTQRGNGNAQPIGFSSSASNVSVIGNEQVINISAKGGYNPRVSTAKAGIPTVIRFQTQGTFDCSSYVRIPSLNVNKILPRTGTTEIDLGIPKIGTLQGSCGMGMYPFQIQFE
jgi:plastocyanin domain-containing protein